MNKANYGKIRRVVVCVLSVAVFAIAAPVWASDWDEVAIATANPASSGTTINFSASGMNALSSTQLEGALKSLPGVSNAVADWAPGNVSVTYDSTQISAHSIYETASAMGLIVEQ